MDWADMALASSGTVTLTTGLFGLPTVVTYKLSMASEFIFSSLVNYRDMFH
jgi:lipid A disaccharide synthetase